MDNIKLQGMLESVLAGDCDGNFTDLIQGGSVHCMGAPRVYGVLNAVASCVSDGGLYVEVGTYQGGSMIAALRGNLTSAIGVDSFTEFQTTNNFTQTRANFDRFGIGDRVDLRNMRFEEFFAGVPEGFTMDAYYYDGAHDYETQLAGMEAGWKFLKPGSIVMVDDYVYPEVSRAINQFLFNHRDNLTVRFIMLPAEGLDPKWWNGVVVLQVK